MNIIGIDVKAIEYDVAKVVVVYLQSVNFILQISRTRSIYTMALTFEVNSDYTR